MSNTSPRGQTPSAGSSSISRGGASGGKNAIYHIVNDYYARQQAAYMQKRRHHQAHAPSMDSLIVSPPTASRNTSAVEQHNTGVDASIIGVQDTSTMSTRSTPPVERLLKWSERREQALRQIRDEEERRQSTENTFQPNLSKVRGASDVSRSGTNSNQSTVPPSESSVAAVSSLLPVTERLLAQGALTEQRKDHMRDARNKQLAAEHPFRPILSSSHGGSGGNSYATHDSTAASLHPHRNGVAVEMQSTTAWDYKRGALKQEPPLPDPECTFRPTINVASSVAAAKVDSRWRSDESSAAGHPRNHRTSHRDPWRSTVDAGSERHHEALASDANAYDNEAEPDAPSLEDVLDAALVEELELLRLTCRSVFLEAPGRVSGGSIPSPASTMHRRDFFTTFLANVCEHPKPLVVSTSFRSTASVRYAEAQKADADAQQRAAKQKQAEETDSVVIRGLSPVHQYVIAPPRRQQQPTTAAVPATTSGDWNEDSDRCSSNASSVRFHVEDDDDMDGEAATDMPTPETRSSQCIVPFDGFLMRQDRAYREKQRKLERLMSEAAPPLKPSICENSRAIAAAVEQRKRIEGGGTTASTVTASVGRSRSTAKAVRSSRLLHRPVITPAGQSCPPRGFNDMFLDYQRRQDKLQHSMRQADLGRMDGVTFEPQTNKQRNANVESTLNPRNFHIFEEHLERQRQQQEDKKLEQERQLQLDEFMQCTFKPRVNKLPSYIQRMTNSVTVIREASF